MTFQGPRESDSKMTQNLTPSQRKVKISVAFLSPLPLGPEKSVILSHFRKCHFRVNILWPNGVSQPKVPSALFYKAPQSQFQPPNCKLAASNAVNWPPPKRDWQPQICSLYVELHRNFGVVFPTFRLSINSCVFD